MNWKRILFGVSVLIGGKVSDYLFWGVPDTDTAFGVLTLIFLFLFMVFCYAFGIYTISEGFFEKRK